MHPASYSALCFLYGFPCTLDLLVARPHTIFFPLAPLLQLAILEEALAHNLGQNSSIGDSILEEHTSSNSKLTLIVAIELEADKLAHSLCQCAEFCHRIEMGTLGPQVTCYAQSVKRHRSAWAVWPVNYTKYVYARACQFVNDVDPCMGTEFRALDTEKDLLGFL